MTYLDITRLETQAISNTLVDNKSTYLLVDALAIERWAYVPPSPDSLDIPEVKELVGILKAQDRYIKLNWLWEDTEWHSHYRKGPCLVQLEHDSPLFDYFTETLAEQGFGIIIQTSQSDSTLIEHLQSLLRVTIEGKGPTYFTFHSPSAIASYFDALTSDKMLELLGPIEHLIWRHNTGKAHQWFGYFNEQETNTYQENQPQHGSSKEMGWFHFSQDEMHSINHDALLHFRKSLINDALYYREQGTFERQPALALQGQSEADIAEILYPLLEDASEHQVSDQALKKRWVELHLYYKELIQEAEFQTLLKDTSHHQNKRIKNINQRIKQMLESDKQGEAV